MWIFGYGSLIWRPDFTHLERRPGHIVGWTRRFYQGSPDHRGTPEAPGRVVTLLPEPGARCIGVAYRLAPATAERVLEQLDGREKAGYARLTVEVEVAPGPRDGGGGAPETLTALCYVACRDNPDYLGQAPLERIARHVLTSRGPSGTNLEYVLALAAALRELGADDAHVFGLEARLRALQEASTAAESTSSA